MLLLAAMCCVGAASAYDGTPKLLSDAELTDYNVLVVNEETGKVETKLASSLGSSPNVYLLEDAKDWNTIATDSTTYNGKVLILGDNLDFSKTDSDKMMSYQFTGKIYGNGYLIEGFSVSATENYNGLIRYPGNGLYLNYVQMTNSSFSKGDDNWHNIFGFIIGDINSVDVTVIGCSVYNGRMSDLNSQIGGLVGQVRDGGGLTLKYSEVHNTIIEAHASTVGGLIGSASGKTKNTYVSNCAVIDCWVGTDGGGIGGLVGSASNLTVEICSVLNSIIAAKKQDNGGLLGIVGDGNAPVKFENCYVMNCDISSSDYKIGGLVGTAYPAVTVKSCRVQNCNIKSNSRVGGLAGYAKEAIFENCSALSCNVISTDDTKNVAGILARGVATNFINCHAGSSSILNSNLYVSSKNERWGTDTMTAPNPDTCDNLSLLEEPLPLTFPTKEDIANFPAFKLPYVYVTYDVTAGSLGSPYSDSKKTVDIPYLRSENFNTDRITPIGENGYVLSNWFIGDTQEIRTATPVVSDEIVKANWIPSEYRIIYNLDGGTNAEENPATYNITSQTITLANATKQGYTFEGWYTDESLSTKGNTITSGSTGDKVFWVNWTANKYTVSFNANGGTGGISEEEATYGAAMPDINSFPRKTGYTFAGYFDAKTDGKKYYDKDGKSANNWNKAANATLFAHWTPKTYTVTLSQTDATTKGTESVTATYDSEMPTLENLPTKTGYTFTGYFDTNTTSIQYYNGEGKSVRTWDKANDTTLYANWTANTYTVHFDANGGTGTIADQTFTYDEGEKALSENKFTNDGHTFEGWAESKTEEKKYNDKASVSNLASTKDAVVNLYAVWKIIEVKKEPKDGKVEIPEAESKTVPAAPQSPVVKVMAVDGVTQSVTFKVTSDKAAPTESIPGFNSPTVFTKFEIETTPGTNTKFVIDIEKKGEYNPQYIFLRHYSGSGWDKDHIAGKYLGEILSGFFRFEFPITACSPFAVVYETPVKTNSSSSSRDYGSSIWLPATAEPTPTPAAEQPTQAQPTAAPQQPTQASATPAPFIGLLAGLGAAAVFFGMRRK